MKTSSFSTLILTIALGLFLMLACTTQTPTSQQANSTRDPRIEFKHGSKITVHRSPQQNKTFFTQGDIKISPEIMIDSQKVSGKHAFEIDVTASSQGTANPDKVTLTFLHDTPTRTGWHYPPNTTKFAAVADGQRLEYLCTHKSAADLLKQSEDHSSKCLQSAPLTKDDPSDADYYEALFIDIPFQTFVTISNAKSVQVEMGEAKFALPAETILAFHDFAEIMSNK